MATLYLTNTATSSSFPTTSRTLVESAPASEVQLGPGEFDSGIPGTTDAGQWNPSSALGDTTAAAEISAAAGALSGTRQGWLWNPGLAGRALAAGAWSVQLRLRANQGTGTLGRVMMRVTVVTGSAGSYVTVANLLTTAITGEASHQAGQNGWRANEGSRITVTSTAANFSVTIESGTTADAHTFASGEAVLIELGFGDADSATDRTWRLDYNTSNSFVTTPAIVDPIAGTADGVATASAAIAAKGAVAGTVAGTATTNAALRGRGELKGAVAGLSTTDGDLGGAIAAGAIAGVAAGSSTTTATLGGDGALVGSAAAASSTIGAMRGDGALAGSCAGIASPTGALVGDGELTGATSGSSAATATLDGEGKLAGSSSSSATVDGTLRGVGALTASIAGSSSLDGTLVGGGELAAVGAGSSTALGTLRARAAIAGNAVGASSVIGALREASTTHALAGTAAGIATAIGALLAAGRLAGSAFGSSTASVSVAPDGMTVAGRGHTYASRTGAGAVHEAVHGTRRAAGATVIGRES